MVGYKAYVAVVEQRPGFKEKFIIDARSLAWARKHAEGYGKVISVKEQ